MNIFYLDNNPKTCAEMHCDKHVVKMIVEYAQILSTAHRMIDGTKYIGTSKNGRKITRYKLQDNLENIVYKACHFNHPSTVWARTSSQHYDWLYALWRELSGEYRHRYGSKTGRDHSSWTLLGDILKHTPKNLEDKGFTEPPQAMSHYPECMIEGDSIQAYKNYYIIAKSEFAKWTNRQTPEWYTNGLATEII